ncbi:MAG TPA: hypothetical protein ENI23_04740, partial [bacterium]|nr:hypothetical protein [bacterium]
MKILQKYKKLSNSQKVKLILIIGIAIRLVLMPFFAHIDIMSTYERAYDVAFEGRSLFGLGQQLSHLIEVINLKIYSLFISPEKLLPFATTRETNPLVNLHLFVFKIPYLVFDLIGFYLIKRFLTSKKHKLHALAFYFLNPILIFAVYIFGRYETFPIVFLLVTLLLVKNKKEIWSGVSFSLLLFTRTSFLMILPVYILTAGKNWTQKIIMTLVATLPFVLSIWAKSFFLHSTAEAKWLTQGTHGSYIFENSVQVLPIFPNVLLYPFVIGFSIICFYALYSWLKGKRDWKTMAIFMSMTFALFFSVNIFHPQYLAWIVPLLALTLMEKKGSREILYLV